MKNKVNILLSISILSLGFITVLWMTATDAEEIRSAFVRVLTPQSLFIEHQIEIENLKSYIAGISNHIIYVGQPNKINLSSYDTQLTRKRSDIIVHFESGRLPNHPFFIIEENQFQVIDYSLNQLYDGTLKDMKAYEFKIPRLVLAEAVAIPEMGYAVRTFKKRERELTLARITLDHEIVRNESLLQKQIDGVFCTDGKLIYAAGSGAIVYTYFYRNEFFVTDAELNLKYRAHTIDTFSLVSGTTVRNDAKKTITLAKPSVIINRRIAVSGDQLFINSSVLGNNEDEKQFYQSDAIDVYNLKDGHYINSFYIPEYNGGRMIEFRVDNNRVIVLYEHSLIIYSR